MNKARAHKIHSDIPIPTNRRKHGYWIERAKNMQPGQYIEINNRSEYHSLYSAMCRLGYDSTSKTKNNLMRVWRVR